jgi:DNA polymerase iota
MEDAASAEKRSAEEFRVRVHGGPHPLRVGSEGAATTSGRSRDDDAEQRALQPEPPVDPNASRRIVAHFDVDAFYSQVEELRDPRLVDRPMAVTQKYLIVTCNYPARSAGLKKLMSTQKAKALCPEVVLVSGEDLTPYRACAKKVRAALSRFGTCEKLGLDECWVDLTAEVERRIAGGGPASDPALAGHRHSCTSRVESNNKHRPQDIRAVRGDVRVSTVEADVVEEDPVQERRLRVGASVAAEAREAVRAESGLRMSAGVAHNKTLAKLISGLHKPDDQTVLPASHAARVVEPLPVRALPGVGHGVEKELASRGVSIASDLRRVPRGDVCEWLGARVGGKVHDAAWGVDREEVREKPAPSSVTCEDSFRSCTSWDSVDKVLGSSRRTWWRAWTRSTRTRSNGPSHRVRSYRTDGTRGR